MSTATSRTHDAPLTSDGMEIAASLPPGSYELRSTNDGVLVLRRQTADSGKPSRAELEEANREGLKRIVAAGGGARQ